MSDRLSFETLNGLDTIATPELIPDSHWGLTKIYGLYPAFISVIGYPFYNLLGFQGLFLLNFFAFMAINVLLYFFSLKILNSRETGLLAVVFYSFFTFSMQYATAVWPHQLSVLFVFLAVLLTFFEPKKELIFISAFLIVASVGIRISNAIFVPVIFLVWLIQLREKRHIGYFFFGTIIPAIFILYSNLVRFGNPFFTGYKNSEGGYAFAVLNGIWEQIAGFFLLVYRYVFDSTQFNQIFDFVLQPTQYEFGITKALLQSSPYLILAIFALCYFKTKDPKDNAKNRKIYGVFWVLTLLNILYYCARWHHGGAQLSMRYFSESLPFLVILSAITASALLAQTGFRNNRVLLLPVFASAIVILFFNISVYDSMEVTLMHLSTASAIIMGVICILLHFPKITNHMGKWIYIAFCIFFVVALLLSFSINFFDFQRDQDSRSYSFTVYSEVNDHIGNNSVIFTYGPTAWRIAPVKENKDIVIANVMHDEGLHLPDIINGFKDSRDIYFVTTKIHSSWLESKAKASQQFYLEPISNNSDVTIYKFIAFKENSLIYDTNWYSPEDSNSKGVFTRWMSNNATIIFRSKENHIVNLTFNANSFYKPRTLDLYSGDTYLTRQTILPSSFGEISFQIPLESGENSVRLYVPEGCERPIDILNLKNKDTRCLSLAIRNMTIS